MFRESSEISYLMFHSDKRSSLIKKLQNIARHLIRGQDLMIFIFDRNSSDFKERFGGHRRMTKQNVIPEH